MIGSYFYRSTSVASLSFLVLCIPSRLWRTHIRYFTDTRQQGRNKKHHDLRIRPRPWVVYYDFTQLGRNSLHARCYVCATCLSTSCTIMYNLFCKVFQDRTFIVEPKSDNCCQCLDSHSSSRRNQAPRFQSMSSCRSKAYNYQVVAAVRSLLQVSMRSKNTQAICRVILLGGRLSGWVGDVCTG